MRKQNIPDIDDAELFETIITTKQGQRKVRLKNIKDKIKAAYSNFITNGASLDEMEPINLGKIQKRDMEHCYGVSTAGLSVVKSAIKTSHNIVDTELCPYCNLRDPSEFDHYLPKSKFQEFSVYSKNLIWCCHKCNHKKKEHFSKTDRFLNTYYDTIPEEQFLFCRIGLPIEERGISFYLKKPDGITSKQYKDIVDHVQKLNLLESYTQLASQKLPIWFKKWRILTIHSNKIDFTTNLRREIKADIDANLSVYGENHYLHALKIEIQNNITEIVECLY